MNSFVDLEVWVDILVLICGMFLMACVGLAVVMGLAHKRSSKRKAEQRRLFLTDMLGSPVGQHAELVKPEVFLVSHDPSSELVLLRLTGSARVSYLGWDGPLSSSILDISTVVSVPREVALEALMVGVERADLVYNGALQPDVSLMTCSGGVFEDVCTVF